MVVTILLKLSKKSPEKTAEFIGDYLLENKNYFDDFNVVKGFLNLKIKQKYWLTFFKGWLQEDNYGFVPNPSGELYMVE